MPKDAYLKLSEEARTTWNKLDDDSKATILSSLTPDRKKPLPRFPQKSNATSAPKFTFAQLHEFVESYIDPRTEDSHHQTAESARLVNQAQAQAIDTGNIRNILSVPIENISNSKKTPVNKTGIDKPEAIINGTTYRAVSFHITSLYPAPTE